MLNAASPARGGALCCRHRHALIDPKGVYETEFKNNYYQRKLLLIMKLTAIILLTACLTASARGLTQSISIRVKKASLEKVFTEIKKQTGYSIFCNYKLLEKSKPVTINVDNATIDEVMRLCLKDQNLDFEIAGKSIVVKARENVQVENIQYIMSPPLDIKGRVVDEKGEPLEGVTVTVKGTRNATATNDDGIFELRGVDESAILVFTGVNVETYEIEVKGRNNLAFVNLKTKTAALTDVNVTVNNGYQQILRERATGSFYKLDSALLNRAVDPNIISRIQNITSGLQIYRGQLSVRGRSTLFANQNPLIVVDNFPYDGRLENLNPNDIESITVLKDAAAASIWGALAGNGVVVITTKAGRYRSPLKVNTLATITIGNKPDLFYNPAFLNSSDFIDVENFLFDKGYFNAALSNTTTFPSVSPVVEILAKKRAGTITAAQADQQINAMRGLDVRNDMTNYLYRQSATQQYNVNISGGADKANYYLSVGYDNNFSNIVGNNNNRFSIDAVNRFNPVKDLEISSGINLIQTRTSNNGIINIGAIGKGTTYSYAQLVDGNGNPLPLVQGLSAAYIQSAPGKGLLDWKYYPLAERNLIDNSSRSTDTRLTTGIKYTLIKGLGISASYQYLKSTSVNDILYNENSYYARSLFNIYTVINANGTIKRNLPVGDIFNTNNTSLVSQGGRGQLTYNANFKNHTIAAIAGVEIRESKTNSNQNGFYGYDRNTGAYALVNFDTLYRTLPSGSGRIPFNGRITGTLNRFRSYYTNVSYTYHRKYTITGSGRIDQSNFFGYKANQRSVPLWSAGAKWDLTKEGFYHLKMLPQLSLRLTYGYNGNLDKTTSPLTLARYSSENVYSGAFYGTILTPGNPELTWEKTAMLNIGADFGLKGTVLSGSIEYYLKNGKNLIGDAPIDPTTGFRSAKGNFSDMKAWGMDVVLNSNNLSGALKWTSSLLFNYARNKVTNYKGTNASLTILEGRPVASVFVQRWGGLDPLTGDPRGYLADTLTKNYTALNSLNLKDKKYVGSAVPTVFGSLLNNFSYKNISLSINISYRLGYDFVRPSIYYSNLFSSYIGHTDYSQRWQKPGDEAHTNVPSMTYPANSPRDVFYATSEALLTKADNIRIEDIRASYELNKSRWNKMPLNNIQVFALVSNVGVLWKANKNGIDPNYVSAGYLPPVNYSMGFRVGF